MTLLTPAVAISYINADLGPSPNYAWINITWSLGASILVSVGGRLSDIFGRRYFMLCGAIISFVETIVGATGQSIAQMIVSGVLRHRLGLPRNGICMHYGIHPKSAPRDCLR